MTGTSAIPDRGSRTSLITLSKPCIPTEETASNKLIRVELRCERAEIVVYHVRCIISILCMRFHKFLIPLFALPFLLAGCGEGTVTESEPTSPAVEVSDESQNVVVTSPEAAAVVASPLTVTGKARGTWYFEASFPVKLLDDAGNQIASGIAQAEGEWMTEDFVPFSVTMEFTTTASFGLLVLEKDNPSGLPENAAQVVIPVQFGE